MEALEQRPEVLRPHRQHGRKANGRIHGVAATDPVPEAEHVRRVDAEGSHLPGIGGDRHEMAGHGLVVAPQPMDQPVARTLRVGHGFEGGECLGGDNEQRLRRIEIPGRLHEITAVQVGHETERQAPLAVMPERLVGHHRAEIGSPNADVDDIPDGLPRVTLPLPAANAVGEEGHLLEHGLDPGHDILPVHEQGRALGCAQGHVHDGAALRCIDFLAPEHGADPSGQIRFLGQPEQQVEGPVADAVLRIVQEQVHRRERQPLAATRILGEQGPQVQVLHFIAVGGQILPGRTLGERLEAGGLVHGIPIVSSG